MLQMQESNLSECDKVLPPKMPKIGSNILIADEESSNSQEHEPDDDTDNDDGQYKGTGGNQQDDEPVIDAKTVGSTDTEIVDEDYEGIVLTQDILCNIQKKARIPSSWILLDSQSTVDVFCNARMLGNTREAKCHLVLYCNAVTVLVAIKCDLKGYGTIWYHPTGKANILSLNNVREKYLVTLDSGNTEQQRLVVQKEDGLKWIFRPSKKGLYYSDIANDIRAIMVIIRQYSSSKKAW